MEIKGNVHLLFEQSGTFKNEFKKLGYQAEDYDIQNNFGETDNVVDLFQEIESAWGGGPSIFDKMTSDDLIIAFFPCIYFTGFTNPPAFTLEHNNYRALSLKEKLDKILERAQNREHFYELIIKLVGICLLRNLRIVFENPWSTLHYLHNNFLKEPSIIDINRRLRGDYFKKPTGYWFFNCEPTHGQSYQTPKEVKTIMKSKGGQAGICSEDRSMISPDYARNFIHDFILGKEQNLVRKRLF